jgi:hypothetical protein
MSCEGRSAANEQFNSSRFEEKGRKWEEKQTSDN